MARGIRCSWIFMLALVADAEARRPNIIIFLADDLGIGDVGCYDCKDIATPTIDALAGAGVRFTDYYCAAPICAPSRAAMLTGRYPTRIGLSTQKNIASGMDMSGLPTGEVTIAELAGQAGYATAALGKWHLGSTHDCQPNSQGFDYFFGHHASCLDSYSHFYYASEPFYHDLYRNREEVYRDGRYLTDLVTEEAVRFIDEHREQPFLIYVAYNLPHYPMVAPGRFLRRYDHLPRDRRDYAALVAAMDESMGIIMGQLKKRGLTNDSFVFFTSDNGAASPSQRGEGGGSNAPYREYKISLFDGGIHMPAIVSWPGTIPEGQVRHQLSICMDVFNTVAGIMGVGLPEDRVIDGQDWMPFLKDSSKAGHDALFFEWAGQAAVRQGSWKLVRDGFINQRISRQNRATGEEAIFLTDMSRDPGEKTNLRRQHADVVEQLLKRYEHWRSEAALPVSATSPASRP